MVNWAIEFKEFDIKFHSRMSLKGQAVVDFIVKFCNMPEEQEALSKKVWIAYVDGASTRKYSGTRVILKGLNGEEYEVAIQF